MDWKKLYACQLYEACHNQEKPIVMAKIPYVITFKEQENIRGILPPILINSRGDYTLE